MKQSQIKCEQCNNFISSRQINKHIKYCNGLGPKRNRKKIRNGLNWEKGKTIIEIYGEEKAKEIIEKISNSLKGRSSGIGATKEIENSRREKIRISINKRYEDGWDPKCGRAKKYDYESSIAGKIKVDGLWELAVAKYLDTLNIKWERNTKRFEYLNLKGEISTYRPDFYIETWNKYLEIKGYETELDRCKWSQFKYPLIIWRKKDLKLLKIL